MRSSVLVPVAAGEGLEKYDLMCSVLRKGLGRLAVVGVQLEKMK